MNTVPESTITLTESETEFLKRVLLEARELAAQGTPRREDDTCPALTRAETEAGPKPADVAWDTTTFIL